MSVMMSTMERIQADQAFGPVIAAGVDKPISEQEAAEREAAANMAAVQAAADALRAAEPAAGADSAAPQADLPPLPRVGSFVTFYPRPGEVMRGRKEAAAIVVHRDVAKRTLDLVVIYDANDFRDQEKVKERAVEGERGWLQQADQIIPLPSGDIASILRQIEQIRAELADANGIKSALFGDYAAPEQSVLEMLDALDERIGKLEDAKPVVAKRPPRGRRKNKPKAAKATAAPAPSQD